MPIDHRQSQKATLKRLRAVVAEIAKTAKYSLDIEEEKERRRDRLQEMGLDHRSGEASPPPFLKSAKGVREIAND